MTRIVSTMCRGVLIAQLLMAWGFLTSSPSPAAESRFILETRNLPLIHRSLELERPAAPPPASVTGITVPHHLLAADLIARGVWAASGRSYERIVIISPDHFRATRTPFGVTTQAFDDVTGVLSPDPAFSAALLKFPALFSDIGSATQEHGVRSVTPFLRAVFPKARAVAITASSASTQADLDAAAALLKDLAGPETLIVQSTDYSHHLPVAVAAVRDQETLSVFASARPSDIALLAQPAHFDSRAAQYLQFKLQREQRRATPVVIANRNATEYGAAPNGTTSYIVAAFLSDPTEGSRFRYSDQHVSYFGGDLLAGRGFTMLLPRADVRAIIKDEILRRTGGAPLVVNLEGVVLDELPTGANAVQHYMPAALALPLLKELNVSAVSLANNHAWDFGAFGAQETERHLRATGIMPMVHGKVSDLGGFRVLPLTFKRSYFGEHDVIRRHGQLQEICDIRAAAPLVVFAHWGAEYTNEPSEEETAAAKIMADCGVSAIVGNHSHLASNIIEPVSGGIAQLVYSLGNLMFDQKRSNVSGALLELRVFRQGTMALRLVPLPNLFDKALELSKKSAR